MAQRKNSGRTSPRVAFNENRNASATKRGPGRFHKAGKPGNRIAKERPVRAYVALMAAWAAKRVPKWEGETDAHGAFTLIGRRWVTPKGSTRAVLVRRIWLAGISARRLF